MSNHDDEWCVFKPIAEKLTKALKEIAYESPKIEVCAWCQTEDHTPTCPVQIAKDAINPDGGAK